MAVRFSIPRATANRSRPRSTAVSLRPTIDPADVATVAWMTHRVAQR